MSLYRLKFPYTTALGSEHTLTDYIATDVTEGTERSTTKVTAITANPQTVDEWAYNVAANLVSIYEAGAVINPPIIQQGVISGKNVLWTDQEDGKFDSLHALGPSTGSNIDLPGYYMAFTGKGQFGGRWVNYLFGTYDYAEGKGKFKAIPDTFVSSDPDRILKAMKDSYLGSLNVYLVTKPHANEDSTELTYSKVGIRGRVRFGVNRNNYRHNRV